jgi:glutamate-1-semialdehyde 2,1-aminomutase
MEILRQPGNYERIFATGRTLMGQLSALLEKGGFKAQVVGEPPMFDVVFADGPMRDYRDLQRGDKAMAKRFNALLRERGILKGDAKHYISLAHTDADIAQTCDAYAWALEQLAA